LREVLAFDELHHESAYAPNSFRDRECQRCLGD
jgi:hypothetical protein